MLPILPDLQLHIIYVPNLNRISLLDSEFDWRQGSSNKRMLFWRLSLIAKSRLNNNLR